MKSFVTELIDRLLIPHPLVQTIRKLGEFKGRETLFQAQMPQALETLRQVAVIQSTESSNRIEGVTAPLKRIEALVAKKTTPKNRSEQEIAGYRDVLNTIHANYAHIPFTPGMVLQFHRDLFQYSAGGGGRWKSTDNEIVEDLPDGTRVVRFTPVPAHATSEYMEALHREFKKRWDSGNIDKLLLITAYILDFLCVHPFRDGNGRMARLLGLLLLYQAGYEVGRFVSLERIIEDTKESYYNTLNRSDRGWHEGTHDLFPWTEYFLGILIRAYRDFESRIGMLTSARGAKTEMILEAVRGLPDGFRMVDVERLCPNVTRDMIRVVFKDLKKEEKIWPEGRGAAAVWRKRE